MNRKQALLAAKQDVIRSVLEDAYSQVMNMDDAAYFEMLGKMLDKYMLAQDGAICFSKKRSRQDAEVICRENRCIGKGKRRKTCDFRRGEKD